MSERYWRTAFDEPAVPGKASMARILAAVSMVSAIGFGEECFRFMWALLRAKEMPNAASIGVGHLGILFGFAGAFLTAGVLGLLLRKRADGSTAPDDDTPAAVVTTATQTTVQTGTP